MTTNEPDRTPPSEERQRELEAQYTMVKEATPDTPYKHVEIRTLGELEWILEQRKWSVEYPLPEGYTRVNLSRASLSDANLSGAILRFANLSGAIFLSTNLSGADISEANLSGAYLAYANLSRADLAYAKLSGASLAYANLSEAYLSDAQLSNGRFHAVAVRGVNWDNVDLSDVDWSQIPYLGDEIQGDWRARFHLPFLRWPEGYGNHREAARAYQELTKVLRDQNFHDEADGYAYRAQICRRRMFFRKILAWPTRLPQYLFSHLLNLLAGYGYKPERTLFWYLVTVFGFMFMYLNISQGWAPFGLTTPTSLQPHLEWYEALILSVSSFHGRGFFQPVQSLGDPVAAIAAIEAVLGLFIEISFIATFTQRFFGK